MTNIDIQAQQEPECRICAGDDDGECNCWEEGDYWDGRCHGHTPSHCCLCGGSPYCDCCPKCKQCIAQCGCPVVMKLQDGSEVIL